jgi:hypothetical protein
LFFYFDQAPTGRNDAWLYLVDKLLKATRRKVVSYMEGKHNVIMVSRVIGLEMKEKNFFFLSQILSIELPKRLI